MSGWEKRNSRSSGASPDKIKERRDALQPRGFPSNQELVALAAQMQRDIGIKCRRHKLHWYQDCFRGSHATSWLIKKGAATSREDAMGIGNEMMSLGLLYHVSHRHGFSDEPGRLYRFYLDSSGSSDAESMASDCSSNASEAKRVNDMFDSMWARGGAPRQRNGQPGRWTIGAELTKLQARVLDLTLDVEDQKEMSGILLDSITQQIRGMQAVTRLLTEKLAKANQRAQSIERLLAAAAALQLVTLLWILEVFQKPPPAVAAAASAGLLATWAWLRWSRRQELARPHSSGGSSSGPAWQSTAEMPGESPVWEGGGEAERAETSKFELDAQPNRSLLHWTRHTEEGKRSTPYTSRGVPEGSGGAEQPASLGGSGEGGDEATPSPCLAGSASAQRPPNASHFADWPDAPLLIRPRAVTQQRPSGGAIPVNTGRRIKVDSELFEGCAVIWVRGIPSAPADLFVGQRRKTSITVQGRFKAAVGVDDIITGQEFWRPAVNLPAKWLVESVLIKIARSISPSMSIGPMSAPHFLVPVMAAAQEVNVAKAGEEPDPAHPIQEDMRLFDPDLVDKSGGPLPAAKRKKHFWDRQNRSRHVFSTDHVWTFTLYQSQVDMSAYELDVALRFDLTRNLDGQPLQFMVKDRQSGSYLFCFEAWHERLLPAARKAWMQQNA